MIILYTVEQIKVVRINDLLKSSDIPMDRNWKKLNFYLRPINRLHDIPCDKSQVISVNERCSSCLPH
jgi:hypothetical protein